MLMCPVSVVQIYQQQLDDDLNSLSNAIDEELSQGERYVIHYNHHVVYVMSYVWCRQFKNHMEYISSIR